MTPIRVVPAEDQPIVRAGFRALLDSRSDIEVVGEAATGVEAVEQVRAQRPDVAVMDIRMPEMDGLEATRHITADQTLSCRATCGATAWRSSTSPRSTATSASPAPG